ncbi:putative quinol monooxygenase [Coralloluteibacterium stylophorae]|uniref:Antibiotic biosynthesis monooxygenase n=1 Tax=Coralloluteibacterium stylophorae TaxID=1776034 RepID=A0A8J8AWW2_9GAMM|nr:antibiotic biosynthesis monooxygenase [Coralloluteibacterium stylophorae]MBS7458804.1 antibiotic biosynthesis monooxygenase [Coralloluteibacterium stylophorae]
MSRYALLARLEAKPGREAEVEEFLRHAAALARDEAGTLTWYALKLGPSTFAIVDTFDDTASRQAHLTGRIAAALMERAPDLFASSPVIEEAEVLAMKGR